MPSISDGFKLSNNVFIPCLGLETRQMQPGLDLEATLEAAVSLGYRRFDTASAYGNEQCLGKVLRESGHTRSEFFVSTKLWVTDRTYNKALSAFERSIDALGFDYVDLYLVHWPETHGDSILWQSVNTGTWRAMEKLYSSGRARAIGVCNFLTHHIVPLLARAEITPMVNQLEFHPGYWQKSTVDFCQKKGIHVSAWDPFGRSDVLPDAILQIIARKYKVSEAQVSLRWCLQHGVSPLPRTLNKEELAEYTRLFDFRLNVKEMTALDEIPQSCFSGLDPDHVSF